MKAPKNAETDPRISFDNSRNKYVLKEEHGDYEYDAESGLWNPIYEEQDVEQQQQTYDLPKKRKNGDDDGESITRNKLRRSKSAPTAIYISNLPKDVTEKELEEIFSRYGVIGENLQTGDKKIKLYREQDGKTVKGDALIIYFKPESVDLAIQMMDNRELRFGKLDQGTIHVEIADDSYKKKQDKSSSSTSSSRKEDGATVSKIEKSQMQRSFRKINNKIAEWDDDQVDKPIRKNQKVVVLKHIFTLEELEEDVSAELDIKEEIRDECESIGSVTSIILYNLEADGIVTVKFSEAEEAQACVEKMDGRYFDGRRLEAWIMESHEQYKKTKKHDEVANEQERLDEFGKWLESGAK